ncbi:MAG: family 43 glycosylhydrolase [Phycisphaerales bacterium]|nr:family 43 glycosylhydrolase [Phycisphaerales bacterium]
MKKYFCNPLNLAYRYQVKDTASGDVVFREAADPTVVLFHGIYYLFASVSRGFWYSDDLLDWKFHETPELPPYDYAPDVRVVDGRVIFSASKLHEPSSIYVSADPLREPFTLVASPLPFWDPDIFQDDDGRVYFYWGCSNKDPIWGVEMDRRTFQPIGEKQALLADREDLHGWERNGENNRLAPPKNAVEKKIREELGSKPFIEAAYMTKHNGRYYLQYAAPGTEWNVYADGVYVSDKPLGPFVYQKHNPFSSKPGGFITGAGHGSTFADKAGNWWHVSSMRISTNEIFERRIGLFPCGFDADGTLYCDQNFADYPYVVPSATGSAGDSSASPKVRIAPDMMLLSYRAKASASSHQPGFEPGKAADEDIRTWWAAASTGRDVNAWLQLDLGGVQTVSAIQVNFADHQRPVPEQWRNDPGYSQFYKRLIWLEHQKTQYLLEGSKDGKIWQVLKDNRNTDTDLPHDFICFDVPQTLRYIKISQMRFPFNGIPAISGLRVFGKANGSAPTAVTSVQAVRSPNELDVMLTWPPVPEADGYNIRYGLSPDTMYNSWQLYNQNKLNLSFLDKGQRYYLSVDSFNANGVTPGKVIVA